MANVCVGLSYGHDAGFPPGLALAGPPGLSLIALAHSSGDIGYTEPQWSKRPEILLQGSHESAAPIATSFPEHVDQIRQAVLEQAELKLDELVAGTWSAMEARMEQKREDHNKHTSRLEELLVQCQSEIPRLEMQQLELKAQVARYSAALYQIPTFPVSSIVDSQPGSDLSKPTSEAPSSPRFDSRKSAPPPCSPQRRISNKKFASPLVPKSAPSFSTTAELLLSPSSQRFSSQTSEVLQLGPSPSLNRKPRTFGTPQRSPAPERAAFSLMSSPSAHLRASPNVPPSPFVILEDGGSVFTFQHRRMELSVSWGIDFKFFQPFDAELIVEKIRAGGAIDAWNRLCTGGPSAGKELQPGDKITSTNGKIGCEAMLEECRTKLLIKFVVERGDLDMECPPPFPA